MREPVLVILAAGMGSRYGGLKQIDPIGEYGEKIIDYSLYDAARAGFKKAVFVIKEELLSAFQETVFPNVEKFMEVSYVFQKLTDIPEGFTVPEGREKPWGTSHATLVAARTLGDAPYAVINSDDFYGREAFQKIYDFLKNAEDGTDCAMVGYYLKNTVTEHGTVSRGVCEVTEGKLTGIVERLKIGKRESGIAYTEDEGETWTPLADDTVVSMNLFGFPAGFTAILEREFLSFFRENVQKNPMKAEFLLPFTVGSMIDGKEGSVTVLSSADKWYGVTYKEDKEQVMAGIRSLTEQGLYPSPLWK
ncbi:MAG: nucleotidyltransferase [Acutalibacter sp.]|nr:nucleotidyltransferase [Acutalibacter sp.]